MCLAVLGEVQLDLFGTIIHEVSAVAEGMRLVLMQILLQQLRYNDALHMRHMHQHLRRGGLWRPLLRGGFSSCLTKELVVLFVFVLFFSLSMSSW